MYLTSALYTQKFHRIRSSSLSTSVLILLLLLLVGERMHAAAPAVWNDWRERTSQCQTFVIEKK